MRRLWDFPGGITLERHTAASTAMPVVSVPIPSELVIPLQQPLGEPTEALVQPGERVLTGQPIAQAKGHFSAPVHASSSGIVTAIEHRAVPHPSGLTVPCVVIETDGLDEWAELLPALDDRRRIDAITLRQRARDCGLVGLGGAAFPSAVKLNPAPNRPLERVILNGAECDPWISCDDMLMRSRPETIVQGARILVYALQPQETLIAVEDNKPEAIEALTQAVQRCAADEVEVVPVPSRYPVGGERQLIQTLTGREVPSDGLPQHIGMVCHNVATAVAVYEAVAEGRPLISRYVAVTGPGVQSPRVVEARFGTPLRTLVNLCGGYNHDVDRLIVGGAMMGFAVRDDELPVTKATNCLLAGTAAALPPPGPALPCIRCGACADACPASLLPQQLYWHSRAKDLDAARDTDLFDCIECGVCAYVCPSHIPLVDYFRFAKTAIRAEERERREADLARERYRLRQERLERERRETEERRRQKKAALSGSGGADDKKAAIQAALAKAKQKKAQRRDESRAEAGNDPEQR